MNFDPNARYVARKGFLFEGERFEPGDVFDVRGVEIRARQLLRTGRLRQVPGDVTGLAGGRHETGLSVVKRNGTGWFDVIDAAGTPLNERALRRKDAERLATGA